MPPKRALGKGLDALIQRSEPASDRDSSRMIPLSKIQPAPTQPRTQFDEVGLERLAESIRHQGVIQPLILESDGSNYLIVAGERRYRAALLAGLTEVPAVVAQYETDRRLLVSLIENLQREDLNPIDEARAFAELLEETSLTQEQIAKQVGRSRAAIANSLRLLGLSDEIRTALQRGEISPGHARALLSIDEPSKRDQLFRQILAGGISVRDAEVASREFGKRVSKQKKEPTTRPAEIRDIEQQFIESLGTKVRLNGTLTRGTLEIAYFSGDDLERIFELIKVK